MIGLPLRVLNAVPRLAAGLLALQLCGPVSAPGADPGTRLQNRQSPRADLEAVDLADQPIDVFQGVDQAVVLIFIANECPISNRYAPEIRRLYAKFQPRGIHFWLVHPDPDESAAEIRRHAAAYQYSIPILRDPRHVLVRRARVQVTPEAAVFLPNRQLVYHGRIDNLYVDFGKNRASATVHDLETALTAVLAGRPVHPASTRAIGCQIPGMN